MIRVVLLFLMLFPKTATFCRDIYGYINDVNGNPVPNAAVRIMQKNGTILIGQTERIQLPWLFHILSLK